MGAKVESGILTNFSRAVLSLAESRLDFVGRQIDAAFGNWLPGKSVADDAEALYLLARNRIRAGDLTGALEPLAEARSRSPHFPDALECGGEVLDQLGEQSSASSMYERSRLLRRTAVRLAWDRPMVLRRRGRLVAEIANYTWLLRHRGECVFLYVVRANAELAIGKPERAVADYSAALGVRPADGSIHGLRGEAYLTMGRYDEAIAEFDTALEHGGDIADCLGGRAIAHLACGRPSNADADWRRQLAVLPAERAAARACVALRLAEYSIARGEIDRAWPTDSGNPYWALYRLTAACRTGEPYVSGPPRPLDVWPGPLIELHAGRIDGAQALKLAESPEDLAEAHFQLGILHLDSDPAAARAHFEQVLSTAPPSIIERAAASHELMRWRL